MKVAKHTHKAFDGVKDIKGWIIEDAYKNKYWIYFRGAELCVHDVQDWQDELEELE